MAKKKLLEEMGFNENSASSTQTALYKHLLRVAQKPGNLQDRAQKNAKSPTRATKLDCTEGQQMSFDSNILEISQDDPTVSSKPHHQRILRSRKTS